MQRHVRTSEPPGRIDARREAEPDSGRVDRGRIDPSDTHERLQSCLLRSRKHSQAGGDQRAILVDERDDVCDRRESDEVEVAA